MSPTRVDAHKRPIVCIFGCASAKPGSQVYRQAEEIGKTLGRVGYIVANGGFGGVMEASARGAKKARGVTIGVTCYAFESAGKKLKANPYIDHEVPHRHVLQRIKDMMRMSSGFVVMEGGTGTMVEFSLVWEYVCKGLMAKRPIAVVGDFWRPTIERIAAARPRSTKYIHQVETAVELVQYMTQHIHGPRRRHPLAPREDIVEAEVEELPRLPEPPA